MNEIMTVKSLLLTIAAMRFSAGFSCSHYMKIRHTMTSCRDAKSKARQINQLDRDVLNNWVGFI